MKELQFDFGKILVYPQFLVEISNEGVTMDFEQIDVIYQLSTNYYLDRPFGYISYRMNAYSINPMVYRKISTIENLVAVAVVSEDSIPIKRFYKVEELFFDGSMKIFDNFSEAMEWVCTRVRDCAGNCTVEPNGRNGQDFESYGLLGGKLMTRYDKDYHALIGETDFFE